MLIGVIPEKKRKRNMTFPPDLLCIVCSFGEDQGIELMNRFRKIHCRFWLRAKKESWSAEMHDLCAYNVWGIPFQKECISIPCTTASDLQEGCRSCILAREQDLRSGLPLHVQGPCYARSELQEESGLGPVIACCAAGAVLAALSLCLASQLLRWLCISQVPLIPFEQLGLGSGSIIIGKGPAGLVLKGSYRGLAIAVKRIKMPEAGKASIFEPVQTSAADEDLLITGERLISMLIHPPLFLSLYVKVYLSHLQ